MCNDWSSNEKIGSCLAQETFRKNLVEYVCRFIDIDGSLIKSSNEKFG
jgi:hypothetical protein